MDEKKLLKQEKPLNPVEMAYIEVMAEIRRMKPEKLKRLNKIQEGKKKEEGSNQD